MPEAVLRMRVIAPGCERGFAGKAAEDQDARIGRDDGGEGVLADQRQPSQRNLSTRVNSRFAFMPSG
jgi:hypothetical protein